MRASTYALETTQRRRVLRHPGSAVGFMPNGFARSTAGEYTSNMFWIVGIALIASWLVAVIFTPYFGVKLLPRSRRSRAVTTPSTTLRATTTFVGFWVR